jgi:gas vesicle protein
VGVAGVVLFAPATGTTTRGRVRGIAGRARDFLTDRAESLGDGARDFIDEIKPGFKDELNGRTLAMSDLKDKAKEKISDAAEAAKNATDQAADKARDLTHEVGKKIEEGGKRLQNA